MELREIDVRQGDAEAELLAALDRTEEIVEQLEESLAQEPDNIVTRLAYARALHYWQYRHSFCGICGHPNRLRSSGHRLQCSNSECARCMAARI